MLALWEIHFREKTFGCPTPDGFRAKADGYTALPPPFRDWDVTSPVTVTP
jgi:hypothetical protein